MVVCMFVVLQQLFWPDNGCEAAHQHLGITPPHASVATDNDPLNFIEKFCMIHCYKGYYTHWKILATYIYRSTRRLFKIYYWEHRIFDYPYFKFLYRPHFIQNHTLIILQRFHFIFLRVRFVKIELTYLSRNKYRMRLNILTVVPLHRFMWDCRHRLYNWKSALRFIFLPVAGRQRYSHTCSTMIVDDYWCVRNVDLIFKYHL